MYDNITIALYFSQAIVVNNTLYTSGQVGLDPASAKLVEGGVEAEADQVGITHRMKLFSYRILSYS